MHRSTFPPLRQQSDLSLAWLAALIVLLLLTGHGHAAPAPAPAAAGSGARDAALLLRAVNLFDTGHERAAIHVLRDYVGKQPRDVEARRALASFYVDMGLAESAREQIAHVLALVPESRHDRRLMLRLSADTRQWSEALELARKLLLDDPADVEALRLAGRAAFNLDDPAAAEGYLAQTVSAGAADADTHNMLGLILLHRKQYRTAAEQLGQAAALAPDHAMIHNNWGFALEMSRSWEDAWHAYDRALALKPGTASFEAGLRRVEAQLRKRRGA